MDFYEVGLRQGKNVPPEQIDKESLMLDIYNKHYSHFNNSIKRLAGCYLLASTAKLRSSRNQQDYFCFFAGFVSGSEKSVCAVQSCDCSDK